MAAQHRAVLWAGLGGWPMPSSLLLSEWTPGFSSRWPLRFPEGCVLSNKNRTVGPASPRAGHAHQRSKPLCARHSFWDSKLPQRGCVLGGDTGVTQVKPRATPNRSGLEALAYGPPRHVPPTPPCLARSFLCGARGSEIWGFCLSRCPFPRARPVGPG